MSTVYPQSENNRIVENIIEISLLNKNECLLWEILQLLITD